MDEENEQVTFEDVVKASIIAPAVGIPYNDDP